MAGLVLVRAANKRIDQVPGYLRIAVRATVGEGQTELSAFDD